jgi:RNA polymerase sigma factor (sigma-70 family)
LRRQQSGTSKRQRERRLTYLQEVLSYQPGEIVAASPQGFPKVERVYQMERTMLQSLSRHEERTTEQVLSMAAFTLLVERHQRALFVYLRGLVDHTEEARDLLQETFLDAWRAAQQGKPPLLPDGADEEIRRWLFRAAYFHAIDLRRRRRWVSLETTLATAAEPMSTQMPFEDQVVESAVVQATLAALTPKDKARLLYSAVQGFTAAEAAQIMGDTPPGGGEAHLTRQAAIAGGLSGPGGQREMKNKGRVPPRKSPIMLLLIH